MWVSVGSLIWATAQFQPVRQNINLTTDLALTKEMKKEFWRDVIKINFCCGLHQVNILTVDGGDMVVVGWKC